MKNIEQTIIAQYGNSPILKSIIRKFDVAASSITSINNFYNQVWNIQTAEGYGLDFWGRMVGLPNGRKIYLLSGGPYFGFSEAESYVSWGFGRFYSPKYASTMVSLLSDSVFRTLIMAKAYKNTHPTTLSTCNNVVNTLFGSQSRCYVLDNLNMTMTYVFETKLSDIDLSMLLQSDVLPRTMAVNAYIVNGLGSNPVIIQSQ